MVHRASVMSGPACQRMPLFSKALPRFPLQLPVFERSHIAISRPVHEIAIVYSDEDRITNISYLPALALPYPDPVASPIVINPGKRFARAFS